MKTIRHSLAHANTIAWMEKLLSTPLEDNRKFCLFSILVPYLANVRKLPMESSIILLETWLEGCNRERKIDFSLQSIKTYFKNVKGYLPLSRDKLKLEHIELYRDLKLRGVVV